MRNLRTIFCLFFISGFLICSGAEAKENFLKVQFQIFRVQGTLSGDTSLDEKIWNRESPPGVDMKKALTFFTKAKFKLSEDLLEISEKGWFWNGKSLVMDNPSEQDASVVIKGEPQITVQEDTVILSGEEIDVTSKDNDGNPLKLNSKDAKMEYQALEATVFSGEFQLIASPSVVIASGSRTTFRVSSNQDIEYFEKREDSLFELKRFPKPTGLVIEGTYERGNDETVRIPDLKFILHFVEKREPIPGVSLQVGSPVLQTKDFLADIMISSGRDYGILFHPGQGQGILIMRLRIDDVPQKTNTNTK